MVSLINKQLLLTAYAYLFIMEQQEAQQGSEALQMKQKAQEQKAQQQKALQMEQKVHRPEEFLQLEQKVHHKALYPPSTTNQCAPQQVRTANKEEVKQGQTSPPATTMSPSPVYAQSRQSVVYRANEAVGNPFGPPVNSISYNEAVGNPFGPPVNSISYNEAVRDPFGPPAKSGSPQQSMYGQKNTSGQSMNGPKEMIAKQVAGRQFADPVTVTAPASAEEKMKLVVAEQKRQQEELEQKRQREEQERKIRERFNLQVQRQQGAKR